jgi:allantoate deiminase
MSEAPRSNDEVETEAPVVGTPAGREAEPPAADPANVARMIDAIAEMGRDGRGGVSRLAFTQQERDAHELVASWLKEHGFTVRQDAIGNTYGELAGSDPSLGWIGTGSHLDSVPQGGRFDGIAGVVAAVEVARLVREVGPLRHSLRVVAFAAEEGARFGAPCIGSKAVAGLWSADDLDRLRDVDGVTVAETMRGVGLDPAAVGDVAWDPSEWAGFVELHVEQARVLEASGLPIGIVDMVSGSTRVQICLQGRAQHTGGTPMNLRADALAAASEVVLFAERLANDPRYRGARATVGRLRVAPNSITTIPGSVELVVDFRDIDSDRQRRGAEEVVSAAQQVGQRRRVEVGARVIADSSPAVLPIWLREHITAVCEESETPYRVMTSGASHDAQFVNRVVPAGMIFVPSKGGLSHTPDEWTSATEIALGATVLLRSIQRLDEFLATVGASS